MASSPSPVVGSPRLPTGELSGLPAARALPWEPLLRGYEPISGFGGGSTFHPCSAAGPSASSGRSAGASRGPWQPVIDSPSIRRSATNQCLSHGHHRIGCPCAVLGKSGL